MLKGLTLTLILIGYLCIAVFGTGVKDVFQWPGLLLIGRGFMITTIAFQDNKNISGYSNCNLSVGLYFIYMLSIFHNCQLSHIIWYKEVICIQK